MSAPNRTSTARRLVAIVLATATSLLQAQARNTASRTSGIDIFGAVSDTDVAFYGTERHLGGMAGFDYTQFRYLPSFGGRVTPSLELRGTDAPGTPIAERTLQGGVKFTYNLHRLHPYVDVLLGGGSILFNPPVPFTPGFVYASDSSFLFNYGGGLTYDILSKWSILADYEHQSWNLGFTPPVTFSPQSVSLGVVYHLRLKPYRNR